MIKLALFDVDYTLTKKETMIAFFAFMVKKNPDNLLYLPRALVSGALFKLGIFKEKQSKEFFSSVSQGKVRGRNRSAD